MPSVSEGKFAVNQHNEKKRKWQALTQKISKKLELICNTMRNVYIIYMNQGERDEKKAARRRTIMRLINMEIGEHAALTGYIREPSNEMKNIQGYPGILILPGGGFRVCSDREAEPVAAAFFAEGYQAFVLRYTTVTAKPDATIEDPMKDVQDALAWIRSNASSLFLDENKLAMIGFSGGSHLAAASAAHGPLRPNALILGYPGILHSDLRALECPDIIESVSEQTPPTFLFVSREDTVTPPIHALSFTMELDRYGIDYEIHIFKSGPHGMSLAKPLTCSGVREYVNPVFAQWFHMSIDWLKAQFGEFEIWGNLPAGLRK